MFAVRGFLKCNTVLVVIDRRRVVVDKLLEVDGSVHFLLMGDEDES